MAAASWEARTAPRRACSKRHAKSKTSTRGHQKQWAESYAIVRCRPSIIPNGRENLFNYCFPETLGWSPTRCTIPLLINYPSVPEKPSINRSPCSILCDCIGPKQQVGIFTKSIGPKFSRFFVPQSPARPEFPSPPCPDKPETFDPLFGQSPR